MYKVPLPRKIFFKKFAQTGRRQVNPNILRQDNQVGVGGGGKA